MYRRHYAEIREFIEQRKEQSRVLDFDMKDGWKPLCDFLNKPVPVNEPFPKVNETKMIQEKIAVMMVVGARQGFKTMFRHCLWLLPIVAVGYLALRSYSSIH